ncbi:MAG: hypothetical protein A3H96_09440 [Acidobacteria bacterium RIFCSPLOWO2_02_FULL_67_36]|nr:MAG: hypothetical protein A3H96_09440 [Acidobacteria bacterium RIFCSPLOWO2_02_FULL_67_36]OFW25004.1 MAG: hypothetical protein A3G21_16300 [Acidobacteria bacterium RIFCSPLOWO2_12_FULL_66_21]
MNDLLSAYDLEARLQIEHAQHVGTSTDALLDQLRAPRAIVEQFATTVDEIRADVNLSEQGRLTKLDEAKRVAAGSLDRWHQEHVTALDSHIATLTTRLSEKLADGPQPTPLEVQTLVTRLQGMDATERLSLYASAPDMRTRLALEAASEHAGWVPVRRADGGLGWERLVDEDTISRHRDARLRDADPETTRTLHLLERRRGVLRGLGSRARTLVRDVTR